VATGSRRYAGGIMKLFTGILAVALFCGGGGLFAQSGGGVAISPVLKSFSVGGEDSVSFPATHYPIFSEVRPSAAEWAADAGPCAAKIRASSGLAKGSQKPLSILSKIINFHKEVGDAYSKTAAIMVTWTVRIEGNAELANPPSVCSPFYGDTTQKFPEGDADVMLYVDGVQKGRAVSMTIPDMGQLTSFTPLPAKPPPPYSPQFSDYHCSHCSPVGQSCDSVEAACRARTHDPTVTGTATLTAADFGGTFPSEFQLDIMWMNKTTGSAIVSPAGMRNMIITILPVK